MGPYFGTVVKSRRKTDSSAKDFASQGNLDGFFKCSDLLTDGLVHESKIWKRQSAWQKMKSKECASLQICVQYKKKLSQHDINRNLGIKTMKNIAGWVSCSTVWRWDMVLHGKIVWNIWKEARKISRTILYRKGTGYRIKDPLSKLASEVLFPDETFYCIKGFLLDYRYFVLGVTAALKAHKCFWIPFYWKQGKVEP